MSNASPNLKSSDAPRLAPIERRMVGDDVLETLRRAIIAGAFAPGDHLAEGALAQQLGVSRAPVREAMMQLEREGLLGFDRRGAARVKEFTAEDLAEIFTLRVTLETMAARLAAQRMTLEDVARMELNIERTRGTARLLELTLLDVEFHDLVVRAARHTRLLGGWTNLRHQIEVWLARAQARRDASPLTTRDDTVCHHLRLLAALRTGSEDQAASAMREHIEGWRREFAIAPGLSPMALS